jgi:peroxiredoxin
MASKLKGKDAQDFALIDTVGRTVRLLDYRGAKNVVLVFNRGLL